MSAATHGFRSGLIVFVLLSVGCSPADFAVVAPDCDVQFSDLTCAEVFSGDPVMFRLDAAVDIDGDRAVVDVVFAGGAVFPTAGALIARDATAQDCQLLLTGVTGPNRVDFQPFTKDMAYCTKSEQGKFAIVKPTRFREWDPSRHTWPTGAASLIVSTGSQYDFDLTRMEVQPGPVAGGSKGATIEVTSASEINVTVNNDRFGLTLCDDSNIDTTATSHTVQASTSTVDNSRVFCFTTPTRLSGYVEVTYFNDAVFWRIASTTRFLDDGQTRFVNGVPISSIVYTIVE